MPMSIRGWTTKLALSGVARGVIRGGSVVRNMRPRRTLVRLMAASACALAVTLVSACTPESGESLTDADSSWPATPRPAPSSLDERDGDVGPQRNRELWVLPLDEYSEADGRIDNYAEQLLVRPCLAAAGYEWPVPWQDVSDPLPETLSTSGRRLFDERIAREWGYRNASRDSASVRAWAAFQSQTSALNRDAGFNTAMSACMTTVREDRPLLLDEQHFAHGLVVRSAQEAASAPDVVAAAARWHECMLPLGIPSLPDSPQEMPTQQLTDLFGLPQGIDQTSADEGSKPTAEEVAVAVADATCMESSGYSEALYDAEWALQEELISENRPTLDRNRAALEARHRETLSLIAENAPPAP